MKNAVAFFGLTRSLDVTSQNLKDSIVKDHDLFVHTWKLNSKSENWHKSKEPSILKTLNNYKKVRLLHSNLTSLYIEKQDVHEPEFCFWGDQKNILFKSTKYVDEFCKGCKIGVGAANDL